MSTCNPTTDSKGRAWVGPLSSICDQAPLTLGQAAKEVPRGAALALIPIKFDDLWQFNQSNNLHILLTWLLRNKPSIRRHTVLFCTVKQKYYLQFEGKMYICQRGQIHEVGNYTTPKQEN